ncbi:ABC transporter ATP-binding protein [Ruminiclostridium cellobioparum]|uniref:ABC transporter ATP-binding protein n=1 Tax=Ruminiclostridium cellobioparum TaxID=29355 RepID=UPI0004848665|nr:ATP-binding cassette domain-containing protein [Ruminiclostridium cellobioparum]
MQLRAENISFRYGKGDWILKDFNIELNQGEILGLTGPSGCGKSTLAKILAGYERPLGGSVELDSRSFPSKGFNPVQLVFQHPEKAVNPRWQMHRILRESGCQDDSLYRSLGIEESWMKRWPNELSGGELQRFCVARALTRQTRFLIADEMTTMLDAITQAQIWHVVLEYAKQNNMGVLVVSHENRLIERLCDRVVCLRDNAAGRT